MIESKWRKFWEEKAIYKTDLKNAKKPFYNLMMYPYPSAEGLHVGNVYAFTGADIYGRFRRMQGYDVFEPIGFDSGGIHSENYAISVGVHPKIQIPKNVSAFRKQLHMIGNMFDWDHTVDVMQPDYYKWTQWLFTKMFKAGLAYKKRASVTWCPSCKTTLSDEQTVEEGGKRVCERCGTAVVKKELEQWFFRITKYAEKLLQNTYKLDWSQKVLLAQRNWIGKSEGIIIKYQIPNSNNQISVFTTRPDTNFGATFIVLAPEHKFVSNIINKASNDKRKEIENYIKISKSRSEMERISEGREKTGVFTGLYCINQLTGKKMPLWISDFVLGHVGTGAVVGVPGHDQRDFEFAQKFKLPIMRVVVGKDGDKSAITKVEQVQEEEGTIINSGFLNGLEIHKATVKIMDYLEEKGWGKRQIAYKLRDWCISRQRYWGPPIPMIYCPDHNWQPVEEKNLPVLLPDTNDYLPADAGGRSPLARIPAFVNTKCPLCGKPAVRETDVSDTFLDSSWYFLRYPSTRSARSGQVPFDPEITKKWLPVSQYTGGAEHSVLHLLYSRFVTMALHDMGYLEFEEPFPHFYSHGLIIKDGAKMSKSRGNIVNPDTYIAKFGADALRAYLMFLGPFSQGGDFRDSGMIGMYKFLKRVYNLSLKSITNNKKMGHNLQRLLHQTIKKVGQDYSNFKYNTAISALMILVNSWQDNLEEASLELVKTVSLIMAPLTPHLAEELWSHFAKASRDKQLSSVHQQTWPKFDPKLITEDQITIVIQVNGKIRDKLIVGAHHDAPAKEEIITLAQKSERVLKFLAGKKVRKAIFIPGKLVNLVA